MKILVTGASGFVGRPTVRALAALGDVVPIVRVRGEGGSTRAIQVPDIAGAVNWSPILKDIDVVIHLAGRAHIKVDSNSGSIGAYRRTNVEGTARLAKSAAAAGVRRFVFASSVKVHGEVTAEVPFEPTSPFRPEDPYGQSKAEAEDVLRDIEARTGIEIVVVRPPLIYGPRVRANFLRLTRAVERGIPLPLALVKNRRSLVFVENMANLICRLATSDQAAGKAFLVSDGIPVSSPALVRGLAHALGRPARLIPFPPHGLHLACRFVGQGRNVGRLLESLEVDCSLTRAMLNWRPPFSFEAGLVATAAWFRTGRGE